MVRKENTKISKYRNKRQKTVTAYTNTTILNSNKKKHNKVEIKEGIPYFAWSKRNEKRSKIKRDT